MHVQAPSLGHGIAVVRKIDGHMIAVRHVVALKYPRIPIEHDVGSVHAAKILHAVAAALEIARRANDVCAPRADKAIFLHPALKAIRRERAIGTRDRSAG